MASCRLFMQLRMGRLGCTGETKRAVLWQAGVFFSPVHPKIEDRISAAGRFCAADGPGGRGFPAAPTQHRAPLPPPHTKAARAPPGAPQARTSRFTMQSGRQNSATPTPAAKIAVTKTAPEAKSFTARTLWEKPSISASHKSSATVLNSSAPITTPQVRSTSPNSPRVRSKNGDITIEKKAATVWKRIFRSLLMQYRIPRRAYFRLFKNRTAHSFFAGQQAYLRSSFSST